MYVQYFGAMTIQFIGFTEPTTHYGIPLYQSKIPAGFPSPAQDYVEQTLDLNELCIKRPAATYFVRVEGDSMIEAGIHPDDILVVDRSVTPQHGDVVIAQVNGEFTVKELALTPTVQLIPRNKAYPPITFTDDAELALFGVVTNIVRQMTRSKRAL